MTDGSQISMFYAFKKILITGGTGYMGKVLIWKLLHSCPQVDVIYVLMRSKYGKDSVSRREDVFNVPIFENFKKDNPEILKKVVFVSGDVGEEDLGLSKADRRMLIENVSIIFHSAAILKMDASLKTAVNINTIGTIRMLEMALEMKKLEVFVYISTAYCCCDNVTVEEKIYPAKHNPHDIITLTRCMEPELLAKITPQLISPLPNTYIYTKRLTETLLLEYTSKLPLIVARPSIVIPAYKEPLPGWNDNLNGPGAFFVIGGKGLLRTTMMNGNGSCEIIPVDTAINGILALPWANPKEKLLNEIGVYNITQTAHEHITWGILTHLAVNGFNKYPFEKIIWYPSRDPFTTSVLVYTIKMIFLHYLPAYIIDFILRLIGEKPFLVSAHNKLREGEKVLRYFTHNKWIFKHDNLLRIEKLMSDVDKQLFTCNMANITDFQEYVDNSVYGTKKFIFKEDVKNFDSAKRTAKIMYFVNQIATIFKYYIALRILLFVFNMFCSVIESYPYF